jgi:cytochrome P450
VVTVAVSVVSEKSFMTPFLLYHTWSRLFSWIFCFVVAFLLWAFFFVLRKPSKSNSLVYYLKGYPIFGCIFDFTPDIFLKTALEYPKKYGDIIKCKFLGKTGWLITDLTLAKEIWSKRPKFFGRLRSLEYAGIVLNTRKGLVQSNGALWQRLRKRTAPFFCQQNVMKKFDKIVEEMFCWIERLDQNDGINSDQNNADILENSTTNFSSSSDKSTSRIIDMKYESISLTVRIITIVAFGLSTNDPLSFYFFSLQFMKDMEDCFRFSVESALFFLPRWCWKWFPYKLQYEISAKEAIDRMASAAQKIIDHKRGLIRKQGSTYAVSSMLDSLLLCAEEERERSSTDEEIMTQIKITYFGGSDTTAVVISWISYFFAIYPTLRDEVRQEAENVIFLSINREDGTRRKTRKEITSSLSFNITTKLPLTSACIKEVLRLCGPASSDVNQTTNETEPVTLSIGIVINPQDIVFVNKDGIHMNEKVFDHPTNFNPKRWLVEDEEQLRILESNFVPFGYGPRICPGMQLALCEATLATAFLAYFFDISLACSKEEIIRVRNFSAAPNKMPVLLTKVNKINCD